MEKFDWPQPKKGKKSAKTKSNKTLLVALEQVVEDLGHVAGFSITKSWAPVVQAYPHSAGSASQRLQASARNEGG